jgi:hypothetical protein
MVWNVRRVCKLGHIILNTKHPTADAIVASDRAAGEAPAGTEIASDRLPGVPSRFGGVIAGAPRSAAFEANITACPAVYRRHWGRLVGREISGASRTHGQEHKQRHVCGRTSTLTPLLTRLSPATSSPHCYCHTPYHQIVAALLSPHAPRRQSAGTSMTIGQRN